MRVGGFGSPGQRRKFEVVSPQACLDNGNVSPTAIRQREVLK